MRLLTFKNLPFMAMAIVEAYVFNLAIWYGIRGRFNQETEVMVFLGCLVVYFLLPVFLSRVLKKYDIWKKVLPFYIQSGLISAIMILFYSVSLVSEMFDFDNLSNMSHFWERFCLVSLCFLLIMGAVHFFLGFLTIVGLIIRAIFYSKEKSTIEPKTEEVKVFECEPFQDSVGNLEQ